MPEELQPWRSIVLHSCRPLWWQAMLLPPWTHLLGSSPVS